jgi:hypothetical protein
MTSGCGDGAATAPICRAVRLLVTLLRCVLSSLALWGVDDGEPMDWRELEKACLEMAEAGLDRLDSLEALLGSVDALLAATGRTLLTAAARDAPVV